VTVESTSSTIQLQRLSGTSRTDSTHAPSPCTPLPVYYPSSFMIFSVSVFVAVDALVQDDGIGNVLSPQKTRIMHGARFGRWCVTFVKRKQKRSPDI
jgi:hypothetical protein